MAFKVTSIGSVVKDFKESINQILGKSGSGRSNLNNKGGGPGILFDGESLKDIPDNENWIGNARGNKVRYGFKIVDSKGFDPKQGGDSLLEYYLDIPPQAIMQKEIFANNISATRKGVIVETEGVVFKDIVIQGVTGISPGPRGRDSTAILGKSSDGEIDFTKPPSSGRGVDLDSGDSLDSSNGNLSGYREFLYLREFFLKYSRDKVSNNGDRFLVFINEKDGQALIVEPLEFEMSRNSKRPMEYFYKIVLKCIGQHNALLETAKNNGDPTLSVLDQVANVSSNIQATIKIGRGIINQSSRTIQRVSESVDQTFNGPLRQVQYAMEDLADGTSTTLSLPGILLNNNNNAILDIRESRDDINNSINNFSITGQSSTSGDVSSAQEFTRTQNALDSIENDARIPISRTFLEDLQNTTNNLANDLADSFNLGSAGFDALDNRTPTNIASPIKTPSDEEFILLGTLRDIATSLDKALATNGMFQSDVEDYYSSAEQQFNNIVELTVPSTVREITIEKFDSLERISQRELGDANRWLEIVVVNNLIPPYLSETRSDRVLQYGDILLIPVT